LRSCSASPACPQIRLPKRSGKCGAPNCCTSCRFLARGLTLFASADSRKWPTGRCCKGGAPSFIEKLRAPWSKRFADRLDEYSALVAFHLEQGGDLLPAVAGACAICHVAGCQGPEPGDAKLGEGARTSGCSTALRESRLPADVACGQIVSFGWREGLPAEEASRCSRKPRQSRRRSKTSGPAALLHAGFGRLLAGQGIGGRLCRGR